MKPKLLVAIAVSMASAALRAPPIVAKIMRALTATDPDETVAETSAVGNCAERSDTKAGLSKVSTVPARVN
jgi:hypothetical protein